MTSSAPTPSPATWRRYWKLPAAFVLVAVILVVGAVQFRVFADAETETGDDSTAGTSTVTVATNDELDLFDATVVHTVELTFDQADLDATIAEYQESGEKEYFHADITIDGVTIEDVGIRIKGNSTLRTALQNGADPNAIPYLVKLDKYNSGVSYQGYSELALRTAGPRGDDLILEETVTADVLDIVGLEFPETSYTGLSINGGEETLRVVVELLDNGFVERVYDDTGVLYKAQSFNSFVYLGHDPSAYDEAFSQESATSNADLEPLMDFLEFVDTASDEEFESELANWLDIDSFASYVVVNNLLASVDSMPGNGNNYYLWYDSEDDQFTVLAWDLNESFGGFWRASDVLSTELLPDWSNSGGSGVGGGPVARPGAARAAGPGADVAPGAGLGGGPGVGIDSSNSLVDRFLATDSFRAAYEARYDELFEALFVDGAVVDTIEKYEQVLADANSDRNFVTDSELAAAVDNKLAWVAERIEFISALGDW